ncbi:SDR family NAD(P)-dependent oxidoreductase [Rhodococcoides fascians]|uniref:SDR family NAD(P)-dependent oxidoreductase n=1 Tax=Rhodococcoides fascians TaxID=1828 RepID=UPI00050C1DD1|nr:SDR family NAD(P)-dependent oxidoreductase [Rhodococcus fascians]
MNRLANKVMLITGAGSGLGRHVALLAASEGATIVVTDVVASRIQPVVEAIVDKGGIATGVTADVRVEADIEAAMKFAVDTYGRLDIAHANAGVTMPGQGSVAFEDVTVEQWNAVNDVNLLGVFLTIKHAVRAMKSTGGGSIVVTSSAASLVAYPGFGAYVAGKAGVNGLVRAAAFDFGKYGIRVNATCPTHGMSVNFGLDPTAEVVGLSYEELAENWDPAGAVMPLRLPFPPGIDHNAWPVIFLASDESQYMSGVCFPTADGGQHARVSIPFPENWTLSQEAEGVDVGTEGAVQ